MSASMMRASLVDALGVNHEGGLEALDVALRVECSALEKKCRNCGFEDEDGFFRDYESDNDDDHDEEEEDKSERAGLRRASAKSPESVVQGLPEEFFEKDFDPMYLVIEDVSSWGSGDVTERFMSKIEDMDMDKDMVMNRLATMVEANYPALVECAAHVKAIDVDLDHASLQIFSSRRKMAKYTENLILGPTKTTCLQKQREEAILLADLAKSLQMVHSVHNTMLANMVTGDVGQAAECAFAVLESLRTSGLFAQFSALEEISLDVQKSVLVIRQKTDRALMRLSCRKFASSEYSSIIKSYLFLDIMSETMGVEIHDLSSPMRLNIPTILVDSFGCIEGLSNRVLRFQLEDVQACLRTAVLEFVNTSHTEERYVFDVEDFDISELYAKIAHDSTVPCIVRSCELLADVVHTHFLVTQWHKAPFDIRNEDKEHLHKCPITNRNSFFQDDGDEDEEDADDEESPEKNNITAFERHFQSAVLNDNARLKRLQGVRLTIALQQLTQTRQILWDELITALVVSIESMEISREKSTALGDFLILTDALNLMIKIGIEFCDSESQQLKDCIKNLSTKFFGILHRETFNDFCQVLGTVTWEGSSIELYEAGGVFGLLGTSIFTADGDFLSLIGSTLLLSPTLWSVVIDSCSSEVLKNGKSTMAPTILSTFGKQGNPLRLLSKASVFDDEDDEDNEGNEGEDGAAGQLMTESHFVSVLLADVIRPDKMQVAISKPCLDLLALTATRYLEMMHLIPSASREIFQCLCRLYECFLCHVAAGFTTSETRTKVSEDQSEEYALLFELLDGYEQSTPSLVKDKHQDVFACIVATESCCFAAKILFELQPKLRLALPAHYIPASDAYVAQLQNLTCQLRSIVYKSVSQFLMNAPHVQAQIDNGAWESTKSRTCTSLWVQQLIKTCSDIWLSVSNNNIFAWTISLMISAKPSFVCEDLWLEVTQAAFDVTMDGFAKLRKVSSEGRAAFLRDVAALDQGLTAVHPFRALRGSAHLEALIRAGALSENELLNWMRENCTKYAYRHLLGVATQALSSALSLNSTNRRLKGAIALLDELYKSRSEKQS